MGEVQNPTVGLVVPVVGETTTSTWDEMLRPRVEDTTDARMHGSRVTELSGAHPDKRPNRNRSPGPGKGKRAESVHLLTIAIQALQTAREAVLTITADTPKHERERRFIPVVSDAGFAVRSTEEAIERWERGLL